MATSSASATRPAAPGAVSGRTAGALRQARRAAADAGMPGRAARSLRLVCRAGHNVDRRAAILAAAMAAGPAALLPGGLFVRPAEAAYGSPSSSSESGAASAGEAEFITFYGAAAPPATYGSLGGTTPDKAKYSYEVPAAGWVEEATSKVEKGTGGQDSRWVASGSRGKIRAYCLTLNRAGQDGAAYELTDSAINAVAAADSTLQTLIQNGEVSTSKTTGSDGQDYILYNIEASQHYSIKLTIDNTGRLFAFIITAPERTFQQERKVFARMSDSFKTYRSVSQFV